MKAVVRVGLKILVYNKIEYIDKKEGALIANKV